MGVCKRNCDKCLINKDYCGGCSFCESPLCNKNCIQCFTLCPDRLGVFTYLNTIGGLELKINKTSFTAKDLPLHIPIIPDRLKTRSSYKELPVIAIHGGNMFSRNGEKINKGYLSNGFAKALNVDIRTKGILEFYVKDRTLEGFWDNRKNIYPNLKAMNLLAVISPNFSIYEDTPRIDHLYNMKRTNIVYNELLENEIIAVPDISFYNIKDLNRWIRAINDSKIKIISFSFQTVGIKLKASNLWKTYLLAFRYLCQSISSEVSIIVVGIVSKPKIIELYRASCGQNIHILNQSAFVQSRRGTVSETRKQNTSISFDELFIKNINYFNNLYKDIHTSSQKGGCSCLREDQVVI